MPSLSLMRNENVLISDVESSQATLTISMAGMSLSTNMVYGSIEGVCILGVLPVCPSESTAVT